MNFTENIREEILSKPPKDINSKKAFLEGVLRGSGKIYTENDSIGLEVSVSDIDVAILISNYLKSLFNYEIGDMDRFEDRLNKKSRYVFNICGEKVEEILFKLNILKSDENGKLVSLKFYDGIENENDLKSFLRGLFLSSGNCQVPSKDDSQNTGYHLELVFGHYAPALLTSERLAEYNVLTKITRRKETFIVYIKSIEEINNFIAFINAPLCVLKLTDLVINRDIANNSNRQKNCDLGNVSRQIEASIKQVNAIKKIDETIGIETLKEDLYLTAKMRLENQDESLIDLAEKLKVTKSCLNHRLRKIIEIAEEL